MKSWAKPTPEDVARAVAGLARREQQRYFFEKLHNPEWIEPLRGKGFFSKPPEPERNAEEGTIRFVPWPQSQFLARMASEKPALVAEIFLALPETANVSIHEDRVSGAQSMPPREAAALAEAEVEWIEKQEWLYGLYADKAAELVRHLLTSPVNHSVALRLAKALLVLKPSSGAIIRDVKAKFDNYSFARVVEALRPPMVTALSAGAVTFFADLLESGLNIETEGADEDHSYIWRPAIEDHEQNELQEREIPSTLVTVLRETARDVVSANRANADSVLENLLGRNRSIFLRLAYFVARDQGYVGPALSRMLVDRAALQSTALQRDYALLLAASYGSLEPSHKKQILEWIRSSPPARDEEPERAASRAARWKASRLHLIREHLTNSALAEYEDLIKRYGEPVQVDFPYQVGGGWVGPTAPISKEDLDSKSDEEIFQLLQTWAPKKGSWGPEPSRRGLGV